MRHASRLCFAFWSDILRSDDVADELVWLC